eukprot:1159652-Pelagomonas_calceolata.AAC.22
MATVKQLLHDCRGTLVCDLTSSGVRSPAMDRFRRLRRGAWNVQETRREARKLWINFVGHLVGSLVVQSLGRLRRGAWNVQKTRREARKLWADQ